MAFESTIVKHFTDATLVLKDGTGTPVTLTTQLDNGDLKIDGLTPDLKETHAYYSRGTLVGLRSGNPKHPSLSLSFMQAGLSDATDDAILDFLLFRNKYSGNTSTTESIGDVKTIIAELTIAYDAETHVFTINDFHPEVAFAEGEPNTISTSGTVYGAVATT